MMPSIAIEQPPLDTDTNLTEYLSRMFIQTNIALGQNNWLVPIYVQPYKPQVGQLYYFGDAIALDPDITAEGLYIYKSTGWAFIV